MDLRLSLLFLCCMAASLTAATSFKHSTWKPYSHTHPREDGITIHADDHQYLYSHAHHSDFERVLEEEEGEFMLSSTDAHEKRELHALLSFRKGITSDPRGKLSNWTAENSESVCSWYGIRCRPHTRRVLAIDLHLSEDEDFEAGLKGTLSQSLGNLSLLRTLNLSGNSLGGRIPPEMGQLKALQVLDLSSNFYINGSIPVELGMLQKLEHLVLKGSELSGNIPRQLGELPQYFTFFHDLGALILGYNNLHGCIPQHITNLTKLHVLDLSNNKFNGRIPTHLERLSGFANVSNNDNLHEEMEIDIKGIEYILSYLLPTNIIFDLSCNNLIGEIPASIGSMSNLRLLNLSGNLLEGPIPESLSGIPTLEQLDLAKNNLSGPIPEVFSKLSMLASFDVSYNNLCGPIPMATQFSTFNVSSFEKNPCLCSFPLPPCMQKDKLKKTTIEDNGDRSNVKSAWLNYVDEKVSLIALAFGMVIGFSGVVTMLITWKKARVWMLGIPSDHTRKPFYGLYRFPT